MHTQLHFWGGTTRQQEPETNKNEKTSDKCGNIGRALDCCTREGCSLLLDETPHNAQRIMNTALRLIDDLSIRGARIVSSLTTGSVHGHSYGQYAPVYWILGRTQ